ncbi:MAG: hypothetical protein Q7S87_09840 [Agitococcus sp.]|nr:hypothetical protein [Agitococcus sp.]MDO9177085.1 hypothetical protein [Agitococcus sp.]
MLNIDAVLVTPALYSASLAIVHVNTPDLPALPIYVHFSEVSLNGVRRQTLYAAAQENGIEYDHVVECFPEDLHDCGVALRVFLTLPEFHTHLLNPFINLIKEKRAQVQAWASRNDDVC